MVLNWGALTLAVLGYGCEARDQQSASDRPGGPATSAAPKAPTWSELASATYSGIPELPAEVTLVNGRWEGPPHVPGGSSRPALTLMPDFRLVSDLDGNGAEEAVVLLGQSGGGTGENLYLAVMDRQAAGLRHVAWGLIGDRVQIRRARTEQNRILLDVVQVGESDAMCCPGELAERMWALEASALRELVSPAPKGRLSLSVLEGTEWMLQAWSRDEPAPGPPAITFTVAGGRIAGHSGCNRFTATIRDGGSPGDVKIGPLAGTKVACPEPAMTIEQRFHDQMSRVRKYGFAGTRLALTYERPEGGLGAMLFSTRPVPPAHE
jgi:heat shock protein HslJ